jgi:hypothetical protein
VLSQVAISIEGHEILDGIITPLAPLDLMVPVEIFQPAALDTFCPLQEA